MFWPRRFVVCVLRNMEQTFDSLTVACITGYVRKRLKGIL